MSAGKYWLLLFLSSVIAILIFLEIYCENQVASLTYLVSSNESHVSQVQRQNEMLRQLIQRIAIDSQRDPALVSLLANHGIHLSVPAGTQTKLPAVAPPSTAPTSDPISPGP